MISYEKLAVTYDMGDIAKERDALNHGHARLGTSVAQHPDFLQRKEIYLPWDAQISVLIKSMAELFCIVFASANDCCWYECDVPPL